MIGIKTKEQIEIMREGGRKLGTILNRLLDEAQPGVTPVKLDALAGELIKASGTTPSFTTVAGYKWPTCMCVNEVVVHGIPTEKPLVDGDVLTIDIGLINKGLHSDTAWTKIVGDDVSQSKQAKETFLATGRKALEIAITKAVVGGYVGDISHVIQSTIEQPGYSIIKSLVGHGIGYELHEEPQVPNYVRGRALNTYKFRGGETIAIEPIYAMGLGAIVYENSDGWTIATKDRSLTAVFEHSIAITADGPVVLTAVE